MRTTCADTARDEHAFAQLVERQYAMVFAAAVRQVGDAAHAQDVAQAVGGHLVGLDPDGAAPAGEADLADQAEALAREGDLGAGDRAVAGGALLEAGEALELRRAGQRGAGAAAVLGVGDAAARARERDGECQGYAA